MRTTRTCGPRQRTCEHANNPPRRFHPFRHTFHLACPSAVTVHTFFYHTGTKRHAGTRYTPAGPETMPTCRNCGQTDAFAVSLTIVSTITESTYDDPPTIHLDLQCAHCDSTNVDGDPCDSIRPLLTESGP